MSDAKETTTAPAPEADTVLVDEEDAEALKAVAKGYRYFSRKLGEEETALIGSIAPKKLEAGGGSSGDASSAPTPIAAPVAGGASAWNSAGTFEERDFADWFKKRIEELVFTGDLSAPVAGGTLVAKRFSSFEGTASIFHRRGKQNRVMDFRFKVEMRLEGISGPDKGAAPLPPETPDEEAKRKRDGTKRASTPRVVLEFLEVDNDSEGDYPTRLERGKPAPKEELWGEVRSAVGSESRGIHGQIVKALNTVIEEFMTK